MLSLRYISRRAHAHCWELIFPGFTVVHHNVHHNSALRNTFVKKNTLNLVCSTLNTEIETSCDIRHIFHFLVIENKQRAFSWQKDKMRKRSNNKRIYFRSAETDKLNRCVIGIG